MRGALTEATLPVVIRRTCVCPSCLLAAAVKCLVMRYVGCWVVVERERVKISGYSGPDPLLEAVS